MSAVSPIILTGCINSTNLIDNVIRGQLLVSAPKGSVCALRGFFRFLLCCLQIDVRIHDIGQVDAIKKIGGFIAHLKH